MSGIVNSDDGDQTEDQNQHSTAKESSTEDNTDENRCEEKPTKKSWLRFTFKMISDLLLVGFILSNLFTYVLNSNESVKRKTRRPEAFFPEASLVQDYWEGQVFQAFQDAQHFESSFFMFYAAWDRESQESRQVLDSVSHFFRNSDVMVAAVNCWYPISDCAKEFGGKNGTGHILPVFIFYPNTMNGIQYRGHITASHIIRFISLSRWPVVHLHSQQHLTNLQVDCENVLVGYLPNTHTTQLNPSHKELMGTALDFHEIFPEKPVCTAAVTSEALAKQLHLHTSKPIKLYTHNNTFVYPNKTIDSEKVVQWTISNLNPPSSWINLIYKKSFNLKRIFEGGSGNVLLLFSPRPQVYEDQVYDVLRQVSTEYHNCDRSDATQNLVNRLKEKTARGSSQNANSCLRQKSSARETSAAFSPVVTSPSSCQLKPWSVHNPEDGFPACSEVLVGACLEKNSTGGCVLQNKRFLVGHHIGKMTVDPNIKLALQELDNERINAGKLSSGEILSNSKSEVVDITGLGCTSNKTLRMLRVDSTVHSTLLERLGLETLNPPVPVIINLALESIHVQEIRKGYMEEDLRRMISSWHQGTLPDSGKQGYRSTNAESVVRYRPNFEEDKMPDSIVKDLSASTFGEELSGDHDTVLFITSSFCSDCTTASYLFHTAKMYLEKVPDLRFMLIDGTRNDLRWEFNTFSYPAIIFFPKNRPESSRAFPIDSGLNLPSLLRFILSNLAPVQRLAISLNYCDKHCIQKYRIRCDKTISEILQKLKINSQMPVQMRHKFTRKLKYTMRLLRLLDQIQQLDKNNRSENLSTKAIEEILKNNI